MPDSEKLALAVSGWLLGTDAATDKLPVAISAYKVRGLIRKYLAETAVPDRERYYSYMRQESAADMAIVAGLLANMKPPAAPPEPVEGKPGYYEIEVAGLAKEPPMTYYVQLPPEYDPYRRYPTIVTLHGEYNNAENQIDLVGRRLRRRDADGAGRTPRLHRHRPRLGRAAPGPLRLFGPRTAAVLNSLCDACRRFAIDTDRVFLSGHSIGGDRPGTSAWPIPISGRA